MVDFFNQGNQQNLTSRLRQITQMGGYNETPKLPTPIANTVSRSVTMQLPGVANMPGISGFRLPGYPRNGTESALGATQGQGASVSPDRGSDALTRLMRAIRSQESGGNYRAVNRDSGAAGGYQVMPFNIEGSRRGWDYEALGRDISMQQFLNSPQLQDAIARYKLGQYLNRYGDAGAAVAWYGGPGAVKNMHSKTPQAGGYPSLYAYWQSVLSKM